MNTGDTRPPLRRALARHTRRAAVFLVGWVIVGAGAAMLVLPGPGLLVIAGGLGVLAAEFPWARRWRDAVRRRVTETADRAKAMAAARRSRNAVTAEADDDDGGDGGRPGRPPRRPAGAARVPALATVDADDRAA